MITVEGIYYDGRTPVAVPARMEFADGSALLIFGGTSLRHAASLLNVSPRIGRADRFIALPDNGQFQCPDHPVLQSLPQASPSEGPVAWLEERWGIALAGIVFTACLLFAGYYYGLPVVAERVAVRIPVETEQALGRHAITWLDEQKWFKPTNLDLDTQKSYRDGFDGLRSDLPLKNYYQLEFRATKVLGANAFAFPGGTIVITDDMVKAANSEEEVLAVLAHEIGHVELRHTMRSLLQNSAVAVTAAAVTSDAASLSVAVAGIPVLLAQTKYSREFEAAADEFAFKLLKQKGYSPLAFASLMERLAKKHEEEESAFAYVSTHPVTAERVKRARDAAVPVPQGTGVDDIKSGYEAANRRDGYEAIRLYTKAITSGDLSAEKQAIVFNDRGSSWMNKKGYENAIADYNEAIRLNPRFAMAFFNRGIAHFHERQFTLAAVDLKESLQQRADTYTSIWLYLARVNSGANDVKLELVKNTDGTKPDWPAPVVQLYLGKSNPAAVTAAVSNADPKAHKKQMCEADFYLGEWHLITGEKENARLLFSKAESECPPNYLEYAGAVSELERLK
jgi:tetratricopeptide (TPR) repeat protein